MAFQAAAAAVWWSCCAFAHVHVQYVVEKKGKTHYFGKSARDKGPLHDVVHTAWPRPLKASQTVWNCFLEPLPFAFIILAISASGGALITPVLLCHGWLMILRVACFSTTLLPDASQTHAYSGRYQISGGVHSLMFSGHTASTLMAATLCTLWSSNLCTGILTYGICAVQSVGIVLCRKHYTVDVLVAWMVAPIWTAVVCWAFHLV
jgi:hypothetical protein